MKAFEAWLEKEGVATPRICSPDKHYPWRTREEWAYDGFRAALEWAKKEGYRLEDETEGEYSIALIDAIQKELEEK